MTEQDSFAARRAQVGDLIDRQHKLGPARLAAATLVRDYPTRAQSYFLLNLVNCLGNFQGGAVSAEWLVEKVRKCPDHTLAIEGDMQRDRIIGLLRYNRDEAGFALVRRLMQEVERCHAGDLNRLACLVGVNGRMAFAQGQYAGAVRLHARADELWDHMRDEADPVWVYLNRIQWLRATVAAEGRKSLQAHKLATRIRLEAPKNQRNRAIEARVLMAPLGLRVYRIAEIHRG